MIGKFTAHKDVRATFKNNAVKYFGNKNNGQSGAERLANPLERLVLQPKFQLSRTDRFFAIGSCFARNFEFFLEQQKLECLSTKYPIDERFHDPPDTRAPNSALNAYTAQSTAALVDLPNHPRAKTVGLLQTGANEFCDMLLTGIRLTTGEESEALRQRVLETYRELVHATVVIITLGYTEAWFDTLDDVYVNRAPGGSLKTQREAERYLFVNSGHADVRANIEKAIATIRRQTTAKIILTVSPVPLRVTFTKWDVITANLYSKSTLMSAALETATQYDFVDYFPSYELVTLSPRSEAYQEDGVHVAPALVERVVQRFAESYF